MHAHLHTLHELSPTNFTLAAREKAVTLLSRNAADQCSVAHREDVKFATGVELTTEAPGDKQVAEYNANPCVNERSTELARRDYPEPREGAERS